MSASAFEVWDREPDLDGTEWSGFLGNAEVSPELAAAMMRDTDRSAHAEGHILPDPFEDITGACPTAGRQPSGAHVGRPCYAAAAAVKPSS